VDILFVGQISSGSTTLQRMNALIQLGHQVTALSSEIEKTPKFLFWFYQKILARIYWQFGYPLDVNRINLKIINYLKQSPFDILWLDKVVVINPKTLKTLKNLQKNCQIISYSPDDMMIPANQSRYYLSCIPFLDLHVTTKSYNVAELKELGALKVLFIDNAFDPDTHHPILLSKEEKKIWERDVSHVGGYEKDRFEKMLKLADSGIKVTIRGPAWEPYIGSHKNLEIIPGWIYNEDYARAICGSKINLNFLRKSARDKQTTRSIEIPACGGFMLAERTEEHRALFEEGKEAAFFDDEIDLIEKVKFFLVHENVRQRIAAAGRERCIKDGYSNHERINKIITYLRP